LADALTDTASLLGRNIVLRNVNFYGDRHFPLASSYFELDKLLQLLLARPSLRIEIQGYVCCMPENMDGYDADTRTTNLSVQRAKFVYTHLLEQGIQASRMSYRGFGASHKLYPEESNERERELNRRVEIKVLSW
jgi:outer membrane protein OmpA-like peptidoglycan-associated protein